MIYRGILISWFYFLFDENIKLMIKHDSQISVINQMFDTHYLDINIATKSNHKTCMTCNRIKDVCWTTISWNVFLPENKGYKLISGGIYMLLLKNLIFCSTFQAQRHCWKFCNHPKNMEVVKMPIFIYDITNIISLFQIYYILRGSIRELCFDPGSILIILISFDENFRMIQM